MDLAVRAGVEMPPPVAAVAIPDAAADAAKGWCDGVRLIGAASVDGSADELAEMDSMPGHAAAMMLAAEAVAGAGCELVLAAVAIPVAAEYATAPTAPDAAVATSVAAADAVEFSAVAHVDVATPAAVMSARYAVPDAVAAILVVVADVAWLKALAAEALAVLSAVVPVVVLPCATVLAEVAASELTG